MNRSAFMKISAITAALVLAAMTRGLPAEDPGAGAATDLLPRYGSGRIRVLVFDFMSNTDADAPKSVSHGIRNGLAGDENLAVLDIDEINRLVSSGKLASRGLGGSRKAAAYAGWKLRAHKVVIGGITEEGGVPVVDATVIDSASERVEFSKRYRGGDGDHREKYAAIAREIRDSLLGKAALPDKMTGSEGESDESSDGDNGFRAGFGVSSGMLAARGLPDEYLKNAFLAKVHFTVMHDAFPRLAFDLSAGYSKLEAANINEGSGSLLFMPLLATARLRLPVPGHRAIPGLALFAGGGATYVSLRKTQYGETVAASAFDPTACGGAGLSFVPYRGMFLELEGSYHYLFENIQVSYIFAGLRASVFF